MDRLAGQVRLALDRTHRDALIIVARAVGGLFLVLAVLDWFVMAPAIRVQLTGFALFTGLFSLVASSLAERTGEHVRRCYPIAFALVLVLQVDAFAFSYLNANELSASSSAVTLVAIGFMVLDRPWALAMGATVAVLEWAPVALGILQVNPLPYFSVMFSAFVIAGVAHVLRTRHVLNVESQRLELEDALMRIKQLRGLLPICASCKSIRDDRGYWSRLEEFISEHSEAEFTHGICPDCLETEYGELGVTVE